MRRIAFAAVLPAMILAIVSCAVVERPVQVPRLRGLSVKLRPVRVLVGLSTRTEPVGLSAPREVSVFSGEDKTLLATLALDEAQVALSRGSITLGGEDWRLPSLILAPPGDSYINVGDTSYPGLIVLVKRGDAVHVINYVPMEQYIAGVVPCEMPARFSRSAHQAQAVAARTYALWTMTETRLMPYDLKNTEASQVYRGLTKASSYGADAARRTAGVVLVYDWKFLPAFYSSTCGGHTAPASHLSGAPKMPPLSGVPCTYCKHSPRYDWSMTISSDDVEKALASADYISGRLQDLKVTETLADGWVDNIDVISTEGASRFKGNAFRRLIGTRKFYSAKFTVQKSGSDFVIRGHGFGHGVGMCQYGADGLARRGSDYVQILEYYYPGAKAIKIY